MLVVRINHFELLFSYQTLVGIEFGNKRYVSDKKWSSTTQKHIAKWLEGTTHTKVSQDELESMVSVSV